MEFTIINTDEFAKSIKELSKDVRIVFNKKIKSLNDNPYQGKPLGTKWFRELRYRKYRVYFEIFDEKKILLLVGISQKKNQKEIINILKKNSEVFRKMVEKIK